jgi:hypothetical protein
MAAERAAAPEPGMNHDGRSRSTRSGRLERRRTKRRGRGDEHVLHRVDAVPAAAVRRGRDGDQVSDRWLIDPRPPDGAAIAIT